MSCPFCGPKRFWAFGWVWHWPKPGDPRPPCGHALINSGDDEPVGWLTYLVPVRVREFHEPAPRPRLRRPGTAFVRIPQTVYVS